MREVLFRVRQLAGRRAVLATWLLLAAGACGLVALPLMSLPGYELAEALTLLIGVGGLIMGIAAGRQELTLTLDDRVRAAGLAIAAALVTLLLLLVPPFVLAVAWTVIATPCDPFATVAFFPVLTGPTCLLAASAGVFIGVMTRRRRTAAALWFALLLLSAVRTAWPILFGPQVYAYDHLGGYLPGPLYDEELRLPASLLWFRLGTISLSMVFWALSARRLGGRPGWRWGALAVFLAVEALGIRLGFRMSDAALADRLGGLRESAHLVLHYPAFKTADEVERVVRDLEFRHAQLSTFLGGAPPEKTVVWWYRSAEEKQRLVGAAHTQFSKPWRREVHVNDFSAIKHELVHAMAGPLGARPFGVSARFFGLYPNVGIVEGLAVAGENPIDELSLHGWAASMKRQHLLPDVEGLLGPKGFYSAPPARAYTAAGSFLRWLGDTRGGEKLRALYRDGDFARVYGQPLSALAGEWEQFLDGVTLEPEALNQATARFKRGSLFERPCAREVARIAEEAGQLGAEAPLVALRMLDRCATLQPDDPSHVLARASMLRRLGRDDEAKLILVRLATRVAGKPASQAEVDLALVDLALDHPSSDGAEEEGARALLEEIIDLQASPAMDRTARVRLAALSMPPAAKAAIERYFGEGPEEVKLFALRDALAKTPDEPLMSYLLGRRLRFLGEGAEALKYLEITLAGEAPESIQREATRLAIESASLAGRCDRVRSLTLGATSFGPTFAARMAEQIERCDFEQRVFGGPMQRE